MKKKYTQPALYSFGTLEEFIRGTASGITNIDVYGETINCDATCGIIPTGDPATGCQPIGPGIANPGGNCKYFFTQQT